MWPQRGKPGSSGALRTLDFGHLAGPSSRSNLACSWASLSLCVCPDHRSPGRCTRARVSPPSQAEALVAAVHALLRCWRPTSSRLKSSYCNRACTTGATLTALSAKPPPVVVLPAQLSATAPRVTGGLPLSCPRSWRAAPVTSAVAEELATLAPKATAAGRTTSRPRPGPSSPVSRHVLPAPPKPPIEHRLVVTPRRPSHRDPVSPANRPPSSGRLFDRPVGHELSGEWSLELATSIPRARCCHRINASCSDTLAFPVPTFGANSPDPQGEVGRDATHQQRRPDELSPMLRQVSWA